MRTRLLTLGLGLVMALTTLAAVPGCKSLEAAPVPESTCIDACEKRTGGCTETECRRGCRLSLDRLIEREGDNVIYCVAKSLQAKRACNDELWAECAAKIGVHADGGPPAPVKPKEEDD